MRKTVPLCSWSCDVAFDITVTPMREENKQEENKQEENKQVE